MNEQKNHAVEDTYKQVTRYFSDIFSALLPFATAKLAPPDGKSVLEGLELKVAFNK